MKSKTCALSLLSRYLDYKEVKVIYAEILHKNKQKALIKDLAAIFKIKNTFLTNKKLIKVCYNSWADEHLKVRYIENLI